MVELKLWVTDAQGRILCENTGTDEVTLAYRGEYQPGDRIHAKSSKKDILVKIRLDDSLEESMVYLKEPEFDFEIPFGEAKKPYGKKAFTQERHWGYFSVPEREEVQNYRNLALNSFDTAENSSLFPHARTNVKTENPQFFARNAIDGIFETCNHGSWPHSSWGINGRKDAFLIVDFGREVVTDSVIIYLRADFPHDNWWKRMKLLFSDGTALAVQLQKTGTGQKICFPWKKIHWIRLEDLVTSDEESPYPALSQIKVMGREGAGCYLHSF